MSRLQPLRFGAPYGGLHKEVAEYLLSNTMFTRSDNFSVRDKGLQTCLGWSRFNQQVLSLGNATILTSLTLEQFSISTSITQLINLTNFRAYRFDDPQNIWIPITSGVTPVSTTLSSGSLAGATSLSVASTTGIISGQQVIVGFGTSSVEYLVVGTVGVGTFTVTRPSWVTAGTGAQFAHTLGDTIGLMTSAVYDEAHSFDTVQNADVFYFTDGVNPVQRYEQSNDFHENQPGLETGDFVEGLGVLTDELKAKFVRIFSDFMVIAHLTENGALIPNKLRWSQISDYTKWINETDGTGQAGSFLFNGPDFLIRVHQLKTELLFYRDRSIEAMSFVGLPDIMNFRRAESRTGLVGYKAFFDFGDTHIFLGHDNVWEFNGVSWNEIGNEIKQDFFAAIDPGQLPFVEMFFIEDVNELWMSYSTTGLRVHDKAYVFNTKTRVWAGPRDVDATTYGNFRKVSDQTWNSTIGTWDDMGSKPWDSRDFTANTPLSLMANDDGRVFILETAETGDGTTLTKRYESKRTDMGRGDLLKTVEKVRVGLDSTTSPTVDVYLGTAPNEQDLMTWNGPYTMNVTAAYEPFVYMDLCARYFMVAIETTGSTKIQDVELHWYPRSEI